MLHKLIKIANNLDKKGLYQEADALDVILKQAADMSPEEYERYYGKPMAGYEPKGHLDTGTAEGYERYYGKPMPQPEWQEQIKELQLEPKETYRLNTGDTREEAETIYKILEDMYNYMDMDEFTKMNNIPDTMPNLLSTFLAEYLNSDTDLYEFYNKKQDSRYDESFLLESMHILEEMFNIPILNSEDYQTIASLREKLMKILLKEPKGS